MDSTTATSLWDELVGTQPEPDLWVVIATLVAALAVIVPHGLWRLSRNAITIAHEGGHGLVALLTGRTLTGIRLHSDTSGLTVSRGKPYGLGMILTAAAGYTAPPLLGLGGAALLGSGRITSLLWLATALLLAMLVMIRNAYGALTVVLTGGLFVLVSWLACPRCRRRSRTRWCGSCCWGAYARRSSCSRSARGAERVIPTPTSCPG
ncbi:Putative integral membrane protein OS=Streptomyces glaucescens OX=1907 GN=SGLAU_22415 PE=4 SV=1 [Streptomyces glaucescens]